MKRSWLLLASLCAASPAGAAGPTGTAQVSQAIADRRPRVAEFQLIKEAAEELGVRVWLFGGTAAGFAHYVRWDLEREAGDARYPPLFFDYDFTNIYRSTQDADLVVDGSPGQAQALERLIKEKMGFLQGSKKGWEVRLLRQDRVASSGQVKQALLANRDFLDQHTDSNSTGMIELTAPPPGETVVRDLRDWESPVPVFLQDVAADRLHYYWSDTHQETSRFREGHNPPLFSVIRYLVKAFQYHLRVEGEDLAAIRRVVDQFDPQRDREALSPWARSWLERYGANLIRHAVDIEEAWNTLERLGLRGKLISLSDSSQPGSLGWWLSREPLRTWPVGEGDGATAADLGLEVVAHETREFVDYESITRDMQGRPNVLISREGHPGEAAGQGEGFYTRSGREGGRGTGVTIRFQVDPRARAGTDFTVHDGVVVFHNRAALTVIPESLDVSLVEYFRMLRDGVVDHSDRGVGMKLKRRLSLKPPVPGEEAEVLSIVTRALRDRGPHAPRALLAEWFDRPAGKEHPELLDLIEADHPVPHSPLLMFLVGEVFSRPEWVDHPEFIRRLIGKSFFFNYQVLDYILAQPAWARHPQLMEALLRDGRVDKWLLRDVLRGEGWREHPELLRRVVGEMSADRLGSPQSRTLAYREAGFALLRFLTTGHPPTSLELRQYFREDGTFDYGYAANYGHPSPTSREAVVSEMAAWYARFLATARAGIPRFGGSDELAWLPDGLKRDAGKPPPRGEDDREWVLYSRLPPSNEEGDREWIRLLALAHLEGNRPFLQAFTRDGHIEGIPRRRWPRNAEEEEELAALLAEAEGQARQALESRWPAVEALAQALLRQEEGQALSGEQVGEILRGSDGGNPEGRWTEVLGVVSHVAQRGEEECGNP